MHFYLWEDNQRAMDKEIGIIAQGLDDLTPVAQEFVRMIRELCTEIVWNEKIGAAEAMPIKFTQFIDESCFQIILVSSLKKAAWLDIAQATSFLWRMINIFFPRGPLPGSPLDGSSQRGSGVPDEAVFSDSL